MVSKILIANRGVIACRVIPTAVWPALSTAVLGCLVLAQPAAACFIPKGTHEKGIRHTTVVEGSFQLVSQDGKLADRISGPSEPPAEGKVEVAYRGVIIDQAGRRFEVSYSKTMFDQLCVVFRLPDRDETGKFRIKRISRDRYELVEWLDEESNA